MKIQQTFFFGMGVGLGCKGGCERRTEVVVEIQKKNGGGEGSGGGGGVGLGGQVGCDRRIEVHKKKMGGGSGGVGLGGIWVDVNEELM